ncbi:uncharacterized protein LODBEIA_P26350 [Lodderomyces beijingensis]|uniref:Uncharacterized protein n=1 Tax=Lodderomyces beijingensis TaxID=1775926 RepID=A0ABP0ZJU9_9ASCO
MVFQSFIQFAKFPTKLSCISASRLRKSSRTPFFRSSFPYLHTSYYYQGLQTYNDFLHGAKWWTRANRHSAEQHARSFLGISNGHYGLYYSMYNHESERREKQQKYRAEIRQYLVRQIEEGDRTKFRQCMFMRACQLHHNFHTSNQYRHRYRHRGHHRSGGGRHHYRRLFKLKLLLVGFTARFLISRAFKDAQLNLENVKNFSTRLSSSSFFKPTIYLIHSGSPSYSTNPNGGSSSPLHSLFSKQEPRNAFSIGTGVGIGKRSYTTASQILNESAFAKAPPARKKQRTLAADETKTSGGDAAGADDFNEQFLTTQLHNIQTKYDNHKTPSDLDIIYPIYQTIKRNGLTLPEIALYDVVLKSIDGRSLDSEVELQAIEAKLTTLLTVYQDILGAGVKPSKETYNIVVGALMEGSKSCMQIVSPNSAHYYQANRKAMEYAQISFELLESVHRQLDLKILLPTMVELMLKYPPLKSEKVMRILLPIVQSLDSADDKLNFDAMKFVQLLGSHNVNIIAGAETYSLVEKIYSNLRESSVDEFEIYSAMMNALMQNNFTNAASQFLDNVLIDYKESLQFAKRPRKQQVSDLIAAFLDKFATKYGYIKGLDLLKKFQSVAYLPELPVSLYNKFINELSKSEGQYENMWQLYNRMALRRDFQSKSTMDLMSFNGDVACRDLLLSLSIQAGDHERVFQLLKELLLKGHLIGDHQTLQLLLHYLNNGVTLNRAEGEFFNSYYFGLLCQILESQAKYYDASNHLSDFVSEFIPYMMIAVPAELHSDGLAICSVVNYNVQSLLNSFLVAKAIDKFDLQKDNIYGIVFVAQQLMSYTGNSESLLEKIISVEARLINEFEDVDNHYIELTDDVAAFKAKLYDHFRSLVNAQTPSSLLSLPIVAQACEYLGVDLGLQQKSTTVINDSHSASLVEDLTYDLVPLLNVNYRTGIAKFKDYFEKGYNFSASTWEVIINEEFVSNHAKEIGIEDILTRIWSCNDCDAALRISLLRKMVEFDDEQVLIQVFAFVSQNYVFESEILDALFRSAKNIGIKSIDFDFVSVAAAQMKHDGNKGWISAYFAYLRSIRDFESIISSCKDFGYEMDDEIKLSFLEAQLEVNPAGFTELLNTLDVKACAKLSVLKIKDALAKGVGASAVLSEEYPGDTVELAQTLSYARFLDSLQQNKFHIDFAAPVRSANHLASSLMTTGNLPAMKTMLKQNDQFDQRELITEMLDMLILARSKYSVPSQVIINKLMHFIKFFKLLDLKFLPVKNFLQIIEILKITKSEILQVLIRRIFGGDRSIEGRSIADVINFYFVEIRLLDAHSKQLVAEELREFV